MDVNTLLIGFLIFVARIGDEGEVQANILIG